MKKKYKKKPSKEESDLPKYNNWLKQQGLPSITLSEYIDYLYGKGLPFDKKSKKSTVKKPKLEVPADRDPKRFPSVPMIGAIEGAKDTRYKVEISKQYPVAIPYNKGGYQCILPSEIKSIGRK